MFALFVGIQQGLNRIFTLSPQNEADNEYRANPAIFGMSTANHIVLEQIRRIKNVNESTILFIWRWVKRGNMQDKNVRRYTINNGYSHRDNKEQSLAIQEKTMLKQSESITKENE